MDLTTAILYIILGIIVILILVLLLNKKEKESFEVRDAILGPDELEKHALELGRSHIAGRQRGKSHLLLSRVNENFKFISMVYEALNNETKNMHATVPAAEWLLDNFYIIEEQVEDIRNTLSLIRFNTLPVLKNGYLRGFPRIYALALELVSHTDGAVDEKVLTRFIKAYQSQSLLYMGELWAAAIMLRVALIENIRQVCEKVAESQTEWQRAEETAEQLSSYMERNPHQIESILKSRIDTQPSSSFIQHLLQRLRKKGAAVAPIIHYLDAQLAERNTSVEAVTELEHQLQAGMQVSLGNSITCLRMVSMADWAELFETLSPVEEILRKDPSGIYSKMDFESRDYYRQKVEKLARKAKSSEINIALRTVECAAEAAAGNNPSPADHIGYYIIGKGRNMLEGKLGNRVSGPASLEAWIKKHPTYIYMGSIILTTFIITAFFAIYSFNNAVYYPFLLSLLAGVLVLIPSSDIAVTLINCIISHTYRPTLLPKLELKEGIPQHASTMVIVPTLLPGEKRVNELLQQIEVTYLANRNPNLFFALVGDFKDAATKNTADDKKIADTAIEGIKRLNLKYPLEGADRFYFFHRHRQFNDRQNKWMGWERKRGAIVELNELFRGSTKTSYSIVGGDVSRLPHIKYVITLDADTQLPIGAARKLVGTMLHPMNQAVMDRKRGIVTEGYGLLQPRIGISITSANSTLFSRIFAGQGGIDPYSTAVSDVYQDLFNEGIFTGKGIYEVDIFQNILRDSLPDNAVLSHDLLEGSYIRTGLVTDIEMVDGYPARFNSYAMRLHRWVRGDWQLIPWLSSMVKSKNGDKVKNPISMLSKWKIMDNHRRSLINPTLLLLLLLGLAVLPGNYLVWLGLGLTACALPILSYGLGYALTRNRKYPRGRMYSTIITGFKASLYQTLLLIVFIPYQAYLMCDAIVRTLWRVFITKRNMLEWVTAADMEANLKNDLKSFWKRMWVSGLFGVLTPAMSIIFYPAALPAAILLGAAWTLAPYAAYMISRPYTAKIKKLSQEDVLKLRKLARKTWAFYEDFAGEEDNYLPPDNFQEEPTRVVAHRTSPTNIGFLLMSTISARDMGYIGTFDMGRRIERVISSIEKLEKWKGHLYNWYDTRTLKVLRPLYVSTVDSGNLIGYLIVLRQALKDYIKKPLVDVNLAYGIRDTINLFDAENTDITFDTGLLEECISKGEYSPGAWKQVVDSLLKTLEEPGVKEKLTRSFWGNKLLSNLASMRDELADIGRTINDIKTLHENLIGRINTLVDTMEFKPLFDERRQLFAIGYNVEEGHLSRSYYDLLASEARQASYIAVVRGEVDRRHWSKLGRKLVMVDRYKGLVSWTGTMFEYLMPLLLMRGYENTLLQETYHFVIDNQKKYGLQRNKPWGVSESGYNAFDISLNYQYKAFGVPELGLKRGLENDIVIAPYATILAVGIDPESTMENIRKLEEEKLEGAYGFYEAVDYTPARLQKDQTGSIVKSFMAHHQGMSVVAINNFINDNIMQTRFHSDPVMKAGELLLQEKIPERVTFTKARKDAFIPPRKSAFGDGNVIRTFGIPASLLPSAHVLSNGNYSVMVTDGGIGYSKHHEIALSRWMKDFRGSPKGFFIYVQNINSNTVWSAAYEPYKTVPESYKAVFSPDKAEYIRKDGNIETRTEITVSPEDNAEIRRVSLTNFSEHWREIEVTSYFEVVLAHPDADIAHPAFSNLFVRTEYIAEYDSLIASRRPRLENQSSVWAVHTISVEGETSGNTQFETDRLKFIGRNRDLSNPAAMDVDQPLTNTQGAVLDPIMSLRKRVKIEPGKTVRVSFIAAMGDTRKKVLELADKYHDPRASNRAFELAWTRSQIESEYLGLGSKDTEEYLNMIPLIIFPNRLRRAWAETILKNRKGQSGLWPFGVSGDLPLILLIITDRDEADLVRWMLKAHELWRLKGIAVDLVIMIEYESSYTQPLQDMIRDVVSASHAWDMTDKRGGVFIRNAKLMQEEEMNLFYAVARCVIRGDGGPVEEQINPDLSEAHLSSFISAAALSTPEKREDSGAWSKKCDEFKELKYYNGLGGFTVDGKEYVICLNGNESTPAPWINVISNDKFGFNVSEVGGGYIWSENSRENKLTPWSNDPVTDSPGEIIYIRDEKSGVFWSMTSAPIRDSQPYIIRHGYGYTVFEHVSSGLEQTLTEFAAEDQPVKLNLVRVKNLSGEKRELTLTYYIRPVLGVNEQTAVQHIITELHEDTGAVLIENHYNSDFAGRTAFIGTSESLYSMTGDRSEFLGINGTLAEPEALKREKLSGRFGAGYDPCVAVQVKIQLNPDEEKEAVFFLGQVKGRQEAASLAKRFKDVTNVKEENKKVIAFWKDKLEALQVSTPDTSMDILLNGWLLYQVISCRVWARSAFYQCGGAFGFRDQLQDVMAAAYMWPELIRKQILLHASRQFIEGDVQHWWHEEAGKGIRTKYSDDLVWLAYVTADYIENTGDWGILDERAGYLESEPLGEHEDERYEVPRLSEESSDIYEHCVRVLERALRFGKHGIPLMGCGDWNDGMNTVGNKGSGESVWLGWFVYTTLHKFIPLCEKRGDSDRVNRFRDTAEKMAQALEKNAWDGSWYRRAYFDDGTPLGSSSNPECSIDSISQSWAAISGVGKTSRVEEAMGAVEKHLVSLEDGLIKLLTPPFDKSELQPGYIKGYVPGVRENGGQYTHAATWVILAFASMGQGDKAWRYFNLINPINHTRTYIEYCRYKVEPYVISADVYAVPPHTGRGGWSWYTGAAGWMYRVGMEHIIGIKRRGEELAFDPCIPKEWKEYNIKYRFGKALYSIKILNPQGISKGVRQVTSDGNVYQGNRIPLSDDGMQHVVEVIMGE